MLDNTNSCIITQVDENTLPLAGAVHSESWRESHRAFCSAEFVEKHDAAHQTAYLAEELANGKQLYMLVAERPVGIVSVKDSLIENLYVLPSCQRRGYGTKLLLFAIGRCKDAPRLWLLDNNIKALSLYTKHGFRPTGEVHRLSENLSEIELQQTLPPD